MFIFFVGDSEFYESDKVWVGLVLFRVGKVEGGFGLGLGLEMKFGKVL